MPLVNLINGGKHASNDLDFQEFIVIPVGRRLDPRGAADLDRGQPRAGRDPARALRQERPQHRRRGRLRAGDLRARRRRSACCTRRSRTPATSGRFRYGLDCAATHYYDREPAPTRSPARRATRDAMIELYLELIRDFDVVTIEDPLDEEDFDGLRRADRGERDPDRRRRPVRHQPASVCAGASTPDAANSLLWKVNQIGTLSEAIDAADLAHRNAYKVVVSERSGRDRGPDHRRPRRRPRRRADQDRRAGPRRAHGQVQPPDPDRGGARRDRRLPGRRARRAGGRRLSGPRGRRATRRARAAAAEPARARRLACDARRARGPPRGAADRRAGPRGLRRPRARPSAAVALDGDELIVDGVRHQLRPGRRVLVVGAGKASLAIAAALEGILGDRLDGGAIAVRDGERAPRSRADRGARRRPSAARASAAARAAQAAARRSRQAPASATW